MPFLESLTKIIKHKNQIMEMKKFINKKEDSVNDSLTGLVRTNNNIGFHPVFIFC
jgi:hypothetical protein